MANGNKERNCAVAKRKAQNTHVCAHCSIPQNKNVNRIKRTSLGMIGYCVAVNSGMSGSAIIDNWF